MRRRLLFRLVAVTTGLGAALLLLELGLHVFQPAPLYEGLPATPDLQVKITGITLRGCSREVEFTTNAIGLRGDPPPGDPDARTVLALGGSTTLCGFLDDRRTWPSLLQGELAREEVWVGNAGFNGHSSRGHVVAMEQLVPRLQPDGLIVLVGINDLAISLSTTQQNARDGVTQRGRRTASRLHGLFLRTKRRFWDDPYVLDHSQRELGMGEAPPLDPARLSPLPADLREALPQLPEFRKNVRAIADQARARGIDVLFLTQPLLYGEGPPWDRREACTWLKGDQRLVVSAETLWRMLSCYNAALLEECRAAGVPCFDLAARIPHDEALFYDLCHFTEAGAALVARELAPAVREHLLASPP